MRRNFYSTFTAQILSASSSFAALIVTSRVMSPSEIGVFAFAIAIFALVSMIQSSGITNYVIFCNRANGLVRRQALAVAIGGSICASIILIFVGLVASLDPAKSVMAWALPLLSLKLFILLPSLVPQIMMIRNEEFGKIALVNLIGGTATSAAQIAFALEGWSYTGLILGELCGAAMFSACILLAGRKYVTVRPIFGGTWGIVRYSFSSTLGSVFAYGYWISPTVLIGMWSNFRAVGLYSRANLLGQLYHQAIGRAIDPVIRSAIARHGRDEADMGVTVSSYLTFIAPLSAALFGFSAIMSYTLVPIIFGEQWTDAIPVMAVLCFAMYFVPLNNFLGSLYLQKGKLGQLAKVRGIGLLVQTCLLIALAPISLFASAIAIVAANACLFFLQTKSIGKFMQIPIGKFLKPAAQGIVVAALPVVLARLAAHVVSIWQEALIVQLFAASIVMAVTFAIVLMITRHPIFDEFGILKKAISGLGRTMKR